MNNFYQSFYALIKQFLIFLQISNISDLWLSNFFGLLYVAMVIFSSTHTIKPHGIQTTTLIGEGPALNSDLILCSCRHEDWFPIFSTHQSVNVKCSLRRMADTATLPQLRYHLNYFCKWVKAKPSCECFSFLKFLFTHTHTHTRARTELYIYIYCYAASWPTGLQEAVRSRQVHQLKRGSHVGRSLPNVI